MLEPKSPVAIPISLIGIDVPGMVKNAVSVLHRLIRPDLQFVFDDSDSLKGPGDVLRPKICGRSNTGLDVIYEAHHASFEIADYMQADDGDTERSYIEPALMNVVQRLNAIGPNADRVFTAPCSETICFEHTSPTFYMRDGICMSGYLYREEEGFDCWQMRLVLLLGYQWKQHTNQWWNESRFQNFARLRVAA